MQKLDTLSQKLTSKIDNLLQSKEELTEDLVKVIQIHSEAVQQHRKNNENDGNDR